MPEPETLSAHFKPDSFISVVPDLVKELNSGKTSLLIVRNLFHLDAAFVRRVKSLTGQGKTVSVVINNLIGVADSGDKLRLLSQLASVSRAFLVNDTDLWENPDVRFNSDAHLLDPCINKTSQYRLTRPYSTFTEKAVDAGFNNDKYISVNDLPNLVKKYQAEGKRVVVVSGVFDVLHVGHLRYFEEAKSRGDVLIILTNSDFSAAKQPKNTGKDRPINPLRDRAETLAAFAAVDHVAGFDESNLLELFTQLENITYVKTEKDLQSETVNREIKLVQQRGGRVFTAAAIKKPEGLDFYSSTAAIDSQRLPGEMAISDEKISPEMRHLAREIVREYFTVDLEKISPLFDEQVDTLLTKLLIWNAKTGQLTSWREKIAAAFEQTASESTAAEIDVIKDLVAAYHQSSEKLGSPPDSMRANLFVQTALAMAGLAADILPIQYAGKETAFGTVIGMKLTDGRMQFIDLTENTIHNPIYFDATYFKLLPAHKNYETRQGQKGFAKRVYFYEQGLRDKAAAVKVLQEVDPEMKKAADEVTGLIRSIWSSFGLEQKAENSPLADFTHLPVEEKEKTNHFSNIVAHGGVSVLDMPVGGAENSRPGIEFALTEGKVDVLEIDIVPSADGKWILSHYVDLGIITERKAESTSLTYAELLQTRLKNSRGEPIDVTLIGLAEALTLIKKHRSLDVAAMLAKIDIKHLQGGNLVELVQAIKSSGIPLDKLILTAGEQEAIKQLHRLDPRLRFELNTVESINYLMANRLMDGSLMVNLFLEYISRYSREINAITVSLMQVAMNTWGDSIFKKLVSGIHGLGLQTQVWVARNLEEYQRDASMGADYVLMHNAQLIQDCIKLRSA